MKTNYNLSQDRVEGLEDIGFQLQVLTDCDEPFEKRCRDLITFKEGLGTAMFLNVVRTIHHWDTGVAP